MTETKFAARHVVFRGDWLHLHFASQNITNLGDIHEDENCCHSFSHSSHTTDSPVSGSVAMVVVCGYPRRLLCPANLNGALSLSRDTFQ